MIKVVFYIMLMLVTINCSAQQYVSTSNFEYDEIIPREVANSPLTKNHNSRDKTVANLSREIDDDKKPRVIVTTDFPPLDVIPGGDCDGPPPKCSDPDDIQSMVRFLLYTNEFEVEALIASAATFANIADKQNLLDIIDLYDEIDENLRDHDKTFPTANYLRSVTYEGRDDTWGEPTNKILGKGMNSEASDAIIRIVDKPDSRPVWITVWGGPREVAQAIWKV